MKKLENEVGDHRLEKSFAITYQACLTQITNKKKRKKKRKMIYLSGTNSHISESQTVVDFNL